MAICLFTIYFVDPDLRIEALFQKDETQQKMGGGGTLVGNFEIEDIYT